MYIKQKMFVKQITQDEALSLAAKGIEVMVLVPGEEGGWDSMMPDTLQKLLSGLMFFRREPALENPIIEDAKEEAGTCADDPAASCEPSGGRKKKVDTGKLLALRKAGWTIEKIADELSVSVGTVCNYLKKLEEEKSAES